MYAQSSTIFLLHLKLVIKQVVLNFSLSNKVIKCKANFAISNSPNKMSNIDNNIIHINKILKHTCGKSSSPDCTCVPKPSKKAQWYLHEASKQDAKLILNITKRNNINTHLTKVNNKNTHTILNMLQDHLFIKITILCKYIRDNLTKIEKHNNRKQLMKNESSNTKH